MCILSVFKLIRDKDLNIFKTKRPFADLRFNLSFVLLYLSLVGKLYFGQLYILKSTDFELKTPVPCQSSKISISGSM